MFLRGLLYCLTCGLVYAVARHDTSSLALWYWLEGTLLTAAFFPLVRRGPARDRNFALSVWPVLFAVGIVTLASEAYIFISVPWRQIAITSAGDLLLYTLLTVVMMVLRAPFGVVDLTAATELPRRSPGAISAYLLLAGLVYLVLYFVFGGIFYRALTRPYYESLSTLRSGQSVVTHLGFWFPLMQIARGALMTASAVPLLYALRMKRAHAAVVMGAILWVVGGVAPLVIPSPLMPARLRLYHIAEIFTQNFVLGVIAGLLLTPKKTHAPSLQAAAGR